MTIEPPRRPERLVDQPRRPERLVDHPWKRVPPELALACVLWAGLLVGFGGALQQRAPTPPAPTPRPIDTRIVVVTPPPPPPKPKPKPRPVRPRQQRAATAPRRALPPPRPAPARVASRDALPIKAPPPPRAQPSLPPAPENAPTGGDSSALATYNPTPQVPEDLRGEPIDVVAVARFQVAANGTATVELVERTPNARLDRALLATLRTWRFYPALEKGQPVASTLDVRVPVKVE